MSLALDHPWVLVLLPLAALPLIWDPRPRLSWPSTALLPTDPLSRFTEAGLRLAAGLLIALLLLGLGGLHRPAHAVPRLGQGAEIVLLLDRSTSMDRPFAGGSASPWRSLMVEAGESKVSVARRLLTEFVRQRPSDLYGLMLFSTHPIRVIPLTHRQDLVQAAIRAINVGRGLGRTDLGAGLVAALEAFSQRPYQGSRLVLLISDGGARLEAGTGARVRELARRNRVALYWLYIRSRNSPGLTPELSAAEAGELAPEALLHRFFGSLQTPYRAYSADNPEALGRAIADVSRLQRLPIAYPERIPRREFAPWCYGAGLLLLVPLVLARAAELRPWR